MRKPDAVIHVRCNYKDVFVLLCHFIHSFGISDDDDDDGTFLTENEAT